LPAMAAGGQYEMCKRCREGGGKRGRKEKRKKKKKENADWPALELNNCGPFPPKREDGRRKEKKRGKKKGEKDKLLALWLFFVSWFSAL